MEDLTAILLPLAQLDAPSVEEIVRNLTGRALLRVAPLEQAKLMQVELFEPTRGLPMATPKIAAALSTRGRATFVHVNHAAKQAVLHPFVDGKEGELLATTPDEAFAIKLVDAVGARLETIAQANQHNSPLLALLGKRRLTLTDGIPTGFNSFAFHDRGFDLGDSERVALFAFDPSRLQTDLQSPGLLLRQRLEAIPQGALGPLEPGRTQALQRLTAIGAKPISESEHAAELAELCVFGEATVFAGGEPVEFWDERLLPLLSFSAITATFDESDLEELEECASVLHALVETLSYATPNPPGSIVRMLPDAALAPIAGETSAGAIFLLRSDWLLERLRMLSSGGLHQLSEEFERAWYRAARPGQPEGDALVNWRRAKQEAGAQDLERVIGDLTELRVVLELAATNQLQPAIVLYQNAT